WPCMGGGPGSALIVWGDRGARIVHQPRAMREGERAGSGRVQIVGADASRVLEPPALPDDERDGPTYFLSCLRDGREIAGPCAADGGRDVQEVLAAALRAGVTGRRVSLPPTSHAR